MKKLFGAVLGQRRGGLAVVVNQWIKSLCWLFGGVAMLTLQNSFAETTGEPRVTGLGAHHRTVQTVREMVHHDGKNTKQTNSYVELATGMHYKADPGDPNSPWLESKEVIELLPGGTGAIARQGQHNVVFAPNINTMGVIDLVSYDGKRLRSHVIGLAYTDAATGNSAMIAEVKDSIGLLVAPNQIIYPDAFTDCVADIRYTYTRAGFEQDVILREEPPPPSAYGLNPATTRLEIYTEFLDPPQPTKEAIVIKSESNPLLRATMAEPDFRDETLNFGAMRIGPGLAFPVEANPGDDGQALTVAKSWEQREGRHFLVEKVEYPSIQPLLAPLPKAAALTPKRQAVAKATRVKAKNLFARFASPPVRTRKSTQPMQMASLPQNRTGLLIDYQLSGTVSDLRLRGDTTYFVSAGTTLTGTTIIEGGTVVKFTNGATASKLWFQGPVDCRTSPYRPAIFTAKDDNTVGEILAGSTGNPMTNYYGIQLDFSSNTNEIDLHDVRVRHAYYAMRLFVSGDLAVSHSQFGYNNSALNNVSSRARLRNVLIHDGNYAITAGGTSNSGEHLTCHRLSYLRSSGSMDLTNSLLICVTNNVSYSGINVVTNLDETGVFQTVGAGAHYLANNSSHRNAGTTAINPILLNDLRNRTTFPPVVIPSGDYSNSAALWPQAQRDTDIPDLGYHYDPLDYAFGSVVLWNAQLDVKPGTALATFGQTYGLVLRNGAKFFADGSPTNLVRIARYNTVQEQCGTNWSGYRAPSISFTWWEESSPPEARFRFTQWSTPAQDTHHFYGYEGNPAAVAFSDCQFHGGAIHNVRPVFNVTNSLFERLNMTIHEGLDALGSTFLNNTFIGGALALYQDSGVWTFKDNLFDQTAISIEAGVFTNDYNVYVVITNDTRISTNAPHDIVLTNSPAYELGTLGRYYFPTNDGLLSQLINSGSQTAADAGLYHHTTTSDQVKEGNSTVDRGFHYVALNNGVPFDSDSDGLADYLEDKNGSGTAEGAETNWNDSDTDDDGVPDELEIRQGRNPLIQNTVADTNGIINLRVYTPLK